MNESCEVFEASLSALIDGELAVPDQLPAVDHLLECASCQAFYRRARALGDMLVASQSQSVDPAPEEIWRRIAQESGVEEGSAASRRSRRFPRWTTQLAAVLVLGVGFGWIWLASRPTELNPTTTDTEEAGEVEVILEEDRGSMTDERFVELATEILRADRRYHHQMFEVMSIVTATQSTEGSVDDRPISVERRARRISSGDSDGDESIVWSGDRL